MQNEQENSLIVFTQNGKTSNKIWRWKAKTLWEFSQKYDVHDLPVENFLDELNKDRWFSNYHTPTVINVARHLTRVLNADLQFPIIVFNNKIVLDGTHRLVKAILLGEKTVRAIVLPELPESDPDLKT